MAGVAMGLLGAYVLFIFCAGYLNRRRRFGSSPMRLVTLRGTSLAVAALMACGFGLLVGGPVTALADWGPSLEDRPSGLSAVGVVLFLLALTVLALAQRAMGASWRVGLDPAEHTELVVTGPFRRVRNPIYSALVAMAIGVALMVVNAIALAAVAVLAVGVVLQVTQVEEPYLASIHGPDFEQYRRITGRFMPTRADRRIGSGGPSSGASWKPGEHA